MRIVIDLQSCQNDSRLRGIGRYAIGITRAMLELASGHEFWIALSDRFPESIAPLRQTFAGLIADDRIVVFHLPPGVAGAEVASAWRSRAAEALREHFLASLCPDVLFVPSLFEGFHDECVTSIGRQDVPTVVTVHDLIPLLWPDDYVSQPDERACYDRKLLFLQRADAWLSVSEYARDEASDLLSLPEDRVFNTSAGVESLFRPKAFTPSQGKEILSRLGIDRPFAMFTSAIEHRKNVEGLVRAYALLPRHVRDTHQLILVGSANEDVRARLDDVRRRAGLGDGELVLTGRIDDQDLVALYNLCRLFVFPSLHEGFGLPILEAMACGAPVIGSSVTSIPEVVGRSDALFDPNDTTAMAALIERALTDEPFRASLVEHGRSRAEAFSWRAAAQRALGAFETVNEERLVALAAPAPRSARPRLAYVASLPPSQTPPARRAAALLPHLARRFDVELISDQSSVDLGWLTASLPVRATDGFKSRAHVFDHIVYDPEASSAHDLELMSAAPGVVLLDQLAGWRPHAGLDNASFLNWLVESQGYDAALLALERGRSAAAAAFPLIQETLESAVGVVTLSPALREEAEAWFGAHMVAEWGELVAPVDLPGSDARAAGDALADFLINAARRGPRARVSRLWADIAAPCVTPPSQDDKVAVIRALSANQRPLGRARLLLDIGSDSALPSGPEREAALARLATLLREPSFGRRLEPIHARGAGFAYARAFAAEAIGLTGARTDDEPVQAFAGDAYLAFSPPSAARLPAVAKLRDDAVRLLCLLDGDSGRLEGGGFSPALLAQLSAWMTRRLDAEVCEGALWLPEAFFRRLEAAGEAPDHPVKRAADLALSRLEAVWRGGVQIDALSTDQWIAGASRLSGRLRELDVDEAALNLAALGERQDSLGAGAPTAEFNFVITGHVLGHYSLALVNRAVARVLEQERPGRVRVAPDENGPVLSLDGVPVSERTMLQRLVEASPNGDGPTLVISQHYPIKRPREIGDLNLALFAWEETRAPNEIIRELAAHFDAVLATSRFTAKALIDSGLPIPVVSIGQPADVSAYADLWRRRHSATGAPVSFLHVSSAFPRKGVDLLLKAWARAFRRSDAVKLVIKTFPNPHNDTAALVDQLRTREADAAEIVLVDRDIGQAELLELYAAADVAVCPSRGEGYNLFALEAMAAGIPLIVTDHGGHLDFCGERDVRLLRRRMAPSRSHVAPAHALWAEPDEDDLVAALHEAVDGGRHQAIVARADRARARALVEASPSRWVRRLERLGAALLDRPAAKPLQIAWVSTWNVTCGVAEYSRRLLEGFSASARAATTVICDARIPADAIGGERTIPAWTVGRSGADLGVAAAVTASGANAVVIQHQDGLIPWGELADLLADLHAKGRVTVVVLHNAAKIPLLDDGAREALTSGLRLASRILVHNLADLNLLGDMGLSDNASLLPHGATRPSAAPPVRDLSSAAAKPVIGCHGFFLPGKGMDHLIRACVPLRRTWPGLRLRLITARFPADVSDQEIRRCRELAEALGVADAIEWRTEFLAPEEIARLLGECDLVVMAYEPRTDSASGAVRAALSSLTPVAATRVAIFEELGDAVGWLDSTEPEPLARSIGALLSDRDRRREIQRRAAAWLELHDWSGIASRLEGMLHGLVESERLRVAIDRPTFSLPSER